MAGVKEPIHKRLIKRVQAVTHGQPVEPENQGATTVLKTPRRVFIPKPKPKPVRVKKNIIGK